MLVTSASRTARLITASYKCAVCGADATDSLVAVFTGSSGSSYSRYFISGVISYSFLPSDTYTVELYDVSGETETLVSIFPICIEALQESSLLLDGAETEDKVTPASGTVSGVVSGTTKAVTETVTAEHSHNYDVFIQNDEENGMLYITAVCAACGESLADEMVIKVTFADGTTSYLSADSSGTVNYSYIPEGSCISVCMNTGEEMYAFTVGDTGNSSSSNGSTATGTDGTGASGTTGGTGTAGTDTDGSVSTGDGTEGNGTDGSGSGDGTEGDASTDGSGKAAVCIIIAIVIIALLAFVIHKVMKSRKANKARKAAEQETPAEGSGASDSDEDDE